MKSEKLLKNIKEIKAKKEMQEAVGIESPKLDKAIKIFEAFKKTLDDRKKEVLKLYYLEGNTMVDTAVIIGWSRATVLRDLEAIKEKLESLLKNIDIEELII